MSETTTDPMAEIAAMQTVATALADLDTAATMRVLRWAAERFGLSVGSSSKAPASAAQGEKENGTAELNFKDLAELYDAASPSTEWERALVAGYWFQFLGGEPEFGAQTINSALKNLGHGVSNITNAFETLKAQKPALVMQIKKAGTTKQARKKYKLTGAGKKAVELMVGQQ